VELNLDKAIVRTPVFIEVDMNDVTVEHIDDPRSDIDGRVLIEHGLRAQLKSQSLLTGKLYIEINFYPDTPIQLAGGKSKYAEIPTLPSETEEIFNDIGAIVTRLKNLPLDELFSSLVETSKGLEKLVKSPETVRHLEQIGDILTTLKAIAAKTDKRLDPLVTELTATVTDTRKLVNSVNTQVASLTGRTEKTFAQAEKSLVALENLTGENSPLYVDLATTLEELSDTARSMRILADYLQRNPDAILFGKPGYADD
jgi:paraquat-inducible protein B